MGNNCRICIKSIYNIYLLYRQMVKTIRIEDDALHKELLKLQGVIQAKTGELTSMEDVLVELLRNYKKRKR